MYRTQTCSLIFLHPHCRLILGHCWVCIWLSSKLLSLLPQGFHVLYVHFIKKKKETTLDFWVPFPLPAVLSVFSSIFCSQIHRGEGEGWDFLGDIPHSMCPCLPGRCKNVGMCFPIPPLLVKYGKVSMRAGRGWATLFPSLDSS